jgi:hypothetical protein
MSFISDSFLSLNLQEMKIEGFLTSLRDFIALMFVVGVVAEAPKALPFEEQTLLFVFSPFF